MTKTKIPVGLPHPNPTKAYWQTPPLPIADHRTTPDLPSAAKYVIVGSGVSGATIAWKLYQEESNASIVMLEARQTCSGATGRNGGHCRTGRYLSFKDDLETFGENEALLMERLEEENVKNLGEFAKTHGIDCDLREVETVDIFTDQKKLDHALTALKARRRVLEGHETANILTKHKVWSIKDTRDKLLIPEGLGAISFPAYKLSPYKYVCGVLEMCLEKGLNLQTNTPVVEVSPARNPTRVGKKSWLVYTDRGVISAEKVILGKFFKHGSAATQQLLLICSYLATNAYTAALYPPLAEFIIPTRAQIAAVRPGSKIAGSPVLERTAGLENSFSGEYMQTRSTGTSGAGDIIMGNYAFLQTYM